MNKDIDEWALNDAGWAFINSWNEIVGERMSGNVWNNVKPMLRAAIIEYMQKEGKHE